jgi:hypothetical protein
MEKGIVRMPRKNRIYKLDNFKEKGKAARRQSVRNCNPENFPGKKNREYSHELQIDGLRHLEFSSDSCNGRSVLDLFIDCIENSVL